MGMIYNAYREGTPLLVTAGQQDRRLMFEEPILWSDMVRVVEPWMKWAAECIVFRGLAHRRPPRSAGRADAADWSGCFFSLPMDLQSEIAELDLTKAKPLDVRMQAPVDA